MRTTGVNGKEKLFVAFVSFLWKNIHLLYAIRQGRLRYTENQILRSFLQSTYVLGGFNRNRAESYRLSILDERLSSNPDRWFWPL